jgi:putative tricarboxylic transport membrane protein
LKDLLPNLQDWKDSAKPIVRGTLLGSFLGLFPGGGPTISSFVSYAVEKRFSKRPEMFGTGIIEGVAGPETTNNASAGVAFIPLLCLGIPTTVAMGVLLGGLMVKGVAPGPLLILNNPTLFWGVVGSMYIGNVMLLLLNLPLIGLWVQFLKTPFWLLSALIFLFILTGSYTNRNETLDIFIAISFGIIGYLLKKFEYPIAPLILSYILAPNLEKYLGQSLITGGGSPFIFFSRPISAFFIITALVVLFYPLIRKLLKKERIVPIEDA